MLGMATAFSDFSKWLETIWLEYWRHLKMGDALALTLLGALVALVALWTWGYVWAARPAKRKPMKIDPAALEAAKKYRR